MGLDPEDTLCSNFAAALTEATDTTRDAFIEAFKDSHVDIDVVTYQVLAKLLGEFEGRLLISDAAVPWISDMRACGIAEGLEAEIHFHRENCEMGDECATLDRLIRARKRFDSAVAKVAEKHRVADALLEEMLSALRPSVQKARS